MPRHFQLLTPHSTLSTAARLTSHLENCTGKTFRAKRKRGRFQSEARKRSYAKAKQIRGCHFISIVLGMGWQSRGSRKRFEARSSEEERRVDAKALIADEGRDKLRKAVGSCK